MKLGFDLADGVRSESAWQTNTYGFNRFLGQLALECLPQRRRNLDEPAAEPPAPVYIMRWQLL